MNYIILNQIVQSYNKFRKIYLSCEILHKVSEKCSEFQIFKFKCYRKSLKPPLTRTYAHVFILGEGRGWGYSGSHFHPSGKWMTASHSQTLILVNQWVVCFFKSLFSRNFRKNLQNLTQILQTFLNIGASFCFLVNVWVQFWVKIW